jgi:hypothetical protein
MPWESPTVFKPLHFTEEDEQKLLETGRDYNEA